MSTRIRLYDDAPRFSVERGDDGHIELTITADTATICLVTGRFADDLSSLADGLRQLSDDAAHILESWQDIPDPEDGYVCFDRGRYHVTLAGDHVGDYASQDIAEYELARAMNAGGFFPSAWWVNERGNHHSIDSTVGAHFDDGVLAHLKPLPGIIFQPGDLVRYTNDEPFTHVVIGDWGPYGVEIHVQYEPSIRVLVSDRVLLQTRDRDE